MKQFISIELSLFSKIIHWFLKTKKILEKSFD
jgi:hypothetical protein